MNFKKVPIIAAFVVAAACIVGCGDQNEQKLSQADIMWIKQQRIMQMYGLNNTATSTSTVVQYVTITNTTTVQVH